GRARFPRCAAADGLDAEAGELGVVGAVVGLQVVADGDGGGAAAEEDTRQPLSRVLDGRAEDLAFSWISRASTRVLSGGARTDSRTGRPGPSRRPATGVSKSARGLARPSSARVRLADPFVPGKGPTVPRADSICPAARSICPAEESLGPKAGSSGPRAD